MLRIGAYEIFGEEKYKCTDYGAVKGPHAAEKVHDKGFCRDKPVQHLRIHKPEECEKGS